MTEDLTPILICMEQLDELGFDEEASALRRCYQARMQPIDLSPFCNADGVRYDLSTPFVRGDWKYASNTHLLVRVPAFSWDVQEFGRKTPAVEHLFPKPFPECSIKPPEKLRRGEDRRLFGVVGNTILSGRYIRLLKNLPDIRFGMAVDEAKTMAPFQFIGGDGLVMGLMTEEAPKPAGEATP